MTKETKMTGGDDKAALAELMATFEAFRQTNEARLAEIEAKGASDPLTDERLARIDRRLEALSLKSAQPSLGGDPAPEPDHEHNRAWQRYMRAGDESGLSRLDLKALNTGTEDQGGYVAPPELDRMIEARLANASPMRAIASIRQTSAGVFRKPVSLGADAAWAGETDTRTETPVTNLSLLEFPAGELYAMPAATQTLLEDTFADIDDWLAEEVETAFAAQESAAFVTGDGVGKPKGLLAYSVVDEATHQWGQVGSVPGDFALPDPADQLIDRAVLIAAGLYAQHHARVSVSVAVCSITALNHKRHILAQRHHTIFIGFISPQAKMHHRPDRRAALIVACKQRPAQRPVDHHRVVMLIAQGHDQRVLLRVARHHRRKARRAPAVKLHVPACIIQPDVPTARIPRLHRLEVQRFRLVIEQRIAAQRIIPARQIARRRHHACRAAVAPRPRVIRCCSDAHPIRRPHPRRLEIAVHFSRLRKTAVHHARRLEHLARHECLK